MCLSWQALTEALNDQQRDAMDQQALALRMALQKRRKAEVKLQQHFTVEMRNAIAQAGAQYRVELEEQLEASV